jgi:two-component system cell cycle sensor histidine kinase/response regulator CckA
MGVQMIPVAERRIRVLVVDDEESIRTFAARALAGAGYDVVLASDGPEALRIGEEQGPFDVFVIDIMMPRMRGDELARRIRQRDPDAKVLYFTSYSDQLFEEQVTLGEHEAFLDKPVGAAGLREAVSLLLSGHTNGPEG